MTICFASATRQPDAQAFYASTALGRSLARMGSSFEFSVSLACNSSAGLPSFYNSVLDAAPADIIVFVHDDLLICDLWFDLKIGEAMKEYAIVGIAGSRMPLNHVPLKWMSESEPSGQIGNCGKKNASRVLGSMITTFGPTPARTHNLDGVMIAVNRHAIGDLRFDERFRFHHYDCDLSYRAAKAGISVGTWPIFCVHHCTDGDGYQSPEWRESAELMRAKYSPTPKPPPASCPEGT